ncbi:MAG: ribosome maturation factor RimP [Lachnospiraceae bacterium]|nr:ribosome maturation factor RimP [Lachnospiraceae bacterium]MCI8827019.1 ribosome maturation factor RimP [Lachnospiraceae bacterium]MCI9369969.1 ribosome maturation factor RimP [Lachnospiraceae bacterium]MDE7309337.1 ribosome maturation factor RimP [Lachnospiraceae bacterium]
MSRREEYEKKTEELVMPLIEENNFELVDIEYVKEADRFYLRVYIDKEGGITIDDCEIISRTLEEKLDAKNFISDSYILEISSPGLGRPLKKEKDFERSIGKEVEIKLYRAINRQKDFEGVLKSYTAEQVTIEIDDKEEMVFERKDIALIRLSFDF